MGASPWGVLPLSKNLLEFSAKAKYVKYCSVLDESELMMEEAN